MSDGCSVRSCKAPKYARGWCQRHYARWKRHGNPLAVVIGPDKKKVCKICGKSKGPFRPQRRVCTPCIQEQEREAWRTNLAANRAHNNDLQKKRYAAHREQVLAAYGRRCACCGERTAVFLALDHKKNDGNVHRRVLGFGDQRAGSARMYRWVIAHGFPKDFQLLCHNCNWAKSHGGCPHRKKAA